MGTADPILRSAPTATLSLLSFREESRSSISASPLECQCQIVILPRSPHIWRRELSRRLAALLQFPPKLPLGSPGSPTGHRRNNGRAQAVGLKPAPVLFLWVLAGPAGLESALSSKPRTWAAVLAKPSQGWLAGDSHPLPQPEGRLCVNFRGSHQSCTCTVKAVCVCVCVRAQREARRRWSGMTSEPHQRLSWAPDALLAGGANSSFLNTSTP